MPALVVRTVLGDLAPDKLGRVDYHEHLIMRSPLLAGDELDDAERSAAETALLRAGGIDALVELTPLGVGRDPHAVAAIAERTGVHIVLSTGVHREAHYPVGHWLWEEDTEALAARFVRDVVDDCDPDDPAPPVRAGVIKVGTGYWSISAFEERVLAAAASAHRDVGVAIVCHLERGTAAIEVVERLTASGVAEERVALAHADRNPDPGLHLELTQTGVYLGYDGMGRAKYWPDSVLLDCLLAVVDGGGAERLLLGGDVARRSSFRSYGGLPGMAYLPERFVPRVRAAGGQQLVDTLLVDNPARFLAFSPPAR